MNSTDQEREAFAREDRYIVIKRKDLEAVLYSESRDPAPACAVVDLRIALEKLSPSLPEREYLVIESDWPEYEPVWGMIEARMTGQQPAGVAVPDEILRISELIRSQDNRGTDQPMFAVLEKREVITLDTHDHDRIVWVETGSGDYCEADDRQHNRLEILHHAGRDCDGWARYAVTEVDVFVTCCFTEQGCKDFLERDGHNLRKPYIYAFGSYRNDEYQSVRKWLAAAPHPVGGEQKPAPRPSWLDGGEEAVAMVKEDEANAVAGLVEALKSIRDMTNADDPESYRNDDREGALETCFSVAEKALAAHRAHQGEQP